MRLTRLFAGLGALLVLAVAAPAGAAISQSVAVCDPKFPDRCIKPAADGSIAVTGGGGGGGGTASFTAAATPFTVTAGANKPAGISTANSGQWFIPVKPGTTTEIDLTAPSIVAGIDAVNAASFSNLFPVSADQHGTWNITNISGTISLPTGAATAAKQATLDAAGAAIVPQAGTSNRTLTATTLTLNTLATICPTATNPVATEIYFTTAGVGVGLNGQTLTSAAPTGTTTSSPDIVINTAGTLYTAPVGVSNAITAYGAAGVVRCIQTLRQ